MSNWLEILFSNPATAIIFIICVLGVIVIFTMIARAYAIGKLFVLLILMIIFSVVVKPYLLNFLCGDELTNKLLLLLSLNQLYFGEPLFGLYFLAQYNAIPYPDTKFWFALVIEIFEVIIFGFAMWRSVKSFGKRDNYRKDRKVGAE